MPRYYSPSLSSSPEPITSSPPIYRPFKRRLRLSDMEGISEYNEKMAAAYPQVQERDALEGLLEILGCHQPDLNLIAYTYHKLTHILHHSIRTLTGGTSNTNALPRVCAFPTGSLLMGKPLTDPFKIVVFGSMSPDNYHDLVWEVIQKASEYEIFQSGVTEVQRLPVLRFFIKFDRVDFDLQYHQSVSLINEYYAESSTAAILNTPLSFLDQNCTPQVMNALLEARRCAQQWTRFQDVPHLKHVYYIHRAWASMNGVFDEGMDSKIIHSLLQDHEHPDHVIFRELALAAPRTYLDLLTDKNWLELLQHWDGLPLSAKMVSSNYITISLTTHSGISGVESSSWLRHIENRILILKSRLARFSSTSFASEEPSEPDSRFSSPSKGQEKPSAIELDPLFDPSTWTALSFEFSGAPIEAKIQHRETTIVRLQKYKSPDPNLVLTELAPTIETPNSEFSELEMFKLDSASNTVSLEAPLAQNENNGNPSDSLSLRALSVDGDDIFNVGKIHAILQHKLKDKITLWPSRQELFKNLSEPTDSTAKYSDYEAYYVLGFKTHSKEDWATVSDLVDRWTQEIRLHETTIEGECFITPTLFTSTEYKHWEAENGWFKPSPHPLRDLFLASPNAASEEQSPSYPLPKQRTLNRSSKTSASQSASLTTPSLRRSTEVLNRLRHDPEYDIDEYWIIYKDRHSGFLEIPARDWIKEVSHVAFKPVQRIEVFLRKRGGVVEVMWHRVEKVDRIFGSGWTGEEGDGGVGESEVVGGSVGGAGDNNVEIDKEGIFVGGRMKLWDGKI